MPYAYQFDATQHDPHQGSPSHPVGKFPATITSTEIKPTSKNDGGMFVVEFTTQAGKITNRYNLWNSSPQAVEIAHKQLSALCHCVGVYKIDMNNDGAALRNAQCMIQVGLQKGQPEGGYTELQRVFDRNGNEPGKVGAGIQPAGGPAPQQQPTQAQSPAAPAWGGPPQGQTPQQAPTQPAWSGPPQGQPAQAPWNGGPPQQSQQPQQPQPQWAPAGGPAQQPQNGAPPWSGGAPQGNGGPAPGWSQSGAPAAPPWGGPQRQ